MMQKEKIKISAVRYANTYPFIFGLSETNFDTMASISTDHPAECARKLIEGVVDIGLIPVAALPRLNEYHIITDYCLGAQNKVETVLLLGNDDFKEVTDIHLDYRSLSSITLVKILAHNFWKREFRWHETLEGFDFINIPSNHAVVLIGDQCIESSSMFSNKIDLAEEWRRFTNLPFAFACWTANKKIDDEFIEKFNDALAVGVNNIPAVVRKYGQTGIIKGDKLTYYLTKNMSFTLDEEKRSAIKLFINYMKNSRTF